MKKVLRVLLLILCCGLLYGGSFQKVHAAGLNGQFDKEFCSYLLANFDTDGNKSLSQSEVDAITAVDVRGLGLTSLEGIECLTNLKKLDCRENSIEELDISKNTKLTSLKCSYNLLEQLDISKNTALKTLYCAYNALEELDLSSNTALVDVTVSGNNLAFLDLAKNTAITSATAKNNVHVIPMSKGSDGNYTYDLTKLTGFKSTKASDFQGGTVDGTILTVAPGTKEVTYTYKLRSGFSEKFTLKCYYSMKINETNFPDEKLRKELSEEYDADKNGSLSYSEAKKVRHVSLCPGTNEKGIDKLFALRTIWVWNSDYLHVDPADFTAVDFSELRNLYYLELYDCELSSVSFNNNYTLRTLCLQKARLEAIDVSDQKMLNELNLKINNLETIDVSHNSHLEILDLSSNANLRGLDVTANAKLKELSVGACPIGTIDVSKNTELKKLHVGSCELKNLDVSKNTQLKILNCDWNYLSTLNLDNNKELTHLSCCRARIDSLSLPNQKKLTYLDCSFNYLKSLNIANCTELITLEADINELERLDFSTLLKLTDIDLSKNPLESLVLGKNSNLDYLNVDLTNLTSLNLSGCPNVRRLSGRISYSRTIRQNENEQYELDLTTLPGKFDVKKAGNWVGGTVVGNILTVDKGESQVTYDYDCGNNHSMTVTLKFSQPYFRIVEQPKDIVAYEGDTVEFVVMPYYSNGIDFQWQYKREGDTKWTAVKEDSGKQERYIFTTDFSQNNTQFRCVLTSSTGDTLKSNVVTLTVKEKKFETPVIASLRNAVNGVEVKWNAIPGAAQYRVFYKSGNSSWTGFGNTKEANMVVTGLTEGITYSFTVRCLSADGKRFTSNYDTIGKSIVYKPAKLETPAIAALNNNASGVEVKWNPVVSAAQYRVFYKAAGGTWIGFGNTTDTKITVTGLTAGTTYSFTVRCLSADGKNFTSNYDTVGKSIVYQPTAGTKLATPVISSLSNTVSGVKVQWNAVAGAAQYRVFYKSGDGAWVGYGNTTGTSITVPKLTKDTTYSFTVRCLSVDGKTFTSNYDTVGKSITVN